MIRLNMKLKILIEERHITDKHKDVESENRSQINKNANKYIYGRNSH